VGVRAVPAAAAHPALAVPPGPGPGRTRTPACGKPGQYAGDPVKWVVSGRGLVEADEQSVEDLLAAELSLVGGVIALAFQGGPELDDGLKKRAGLGPPSLSSGYVMTAPSRLVDARTSGGTWIAGSDTDDASLTDHRYTVLVCRETSGDAPLFDTNSCPVSHCDVLVENGVADDGVPPYSDPRQDY
jgi:hypothetical protein